MKLSACIEMLFVNEAPDIADSIALAKQSGFDAIEFWRWSSKDLNRLSTAAKHSEVQIAAIVAEPMIPLTRAENQHEFLQGLTKTVDVANQFGCQTLIAQVGDEQSDLCFETQKESIIATLTKAGKILQGTNIRLGIEPLNTKVDHPGYYMHSTKLGFEILQKVNSANIGMTYDLYHSMVMGESPIDVLSGNLDQVIHVHVADHPGRHEPGSGQLDLKTPLNWIIEQGYQGFVGLEFRPSGGSGDAVEKARRMLLEP